MSEVTQNELGLPSEEFKQLSISRPAVKTVLMISLVGAIMVALLAMLAIGHEPHSIGLTPDELRQRFKHSDPGAPTMTKFYRNPDTGELECSVTGVDSTTGITAKVRNSDHKLGSVTLVWNPPIQDSSGQERQNSVKQFFVTFLLLVEAIDSSLSNDERNQLLYDLRITGSSTTLDKDSQSSKNGFAYHTHWTGNKLALTIEAERDMPPPISPEQTTTTLQINSSSDSTSTARQSTDTNDSQNTVQEAHDPQEIVLDQFIRTGTMTVHFDRAVAARSLSKFGRDVTASPDATYLVVYYSVLNDSGSPISFYPDDGILLGTDDGATFTPDQDAMFVVRRNANIDNKLKLQPGVKKNSVGAFEIPLKQLKNNASIYVSQNTGSGSVPLLPNKVQTAKSGSDMAKKNDKSESHDVAEPKIPSPSTTDFNNIPKQDDHVTESSNLIDDLLRAQNASDENVFKSTYSRLEARTKPAPGNVSEATRLNKLGVAKLKDQHYEDAAVDFLSATTADPSDAKYLSNLGYAEMYAGKLDSARQHLDGSLKIDPSRSVAWGDLGILLAKQGRKDDSVAAFLVGSKVSKDGTIDFLKHLSSNAANDATVREASGLALVRLTQSDESSPTGQSAR